MVGEPAIRLLAPLLRLNLWQEYLQRERCSHVIAFDRFMLMVPGLQRLNRDPDTSQRDGE